MPETSGETYLDHTGMHALSATLATGAIALDKTAAGAPEAPDAGVSTSLVGDLLAGMAGAVGDLVTAVDVTAVSVRRSDETLGGVDYDGARQFSGPGG